MPSLRSQARATRAVTAAAPARWLLLVQQLPTRPSNVRVKTWRRLQGLGAVAVKNSVYALPDSPQAREDFEWLKAEITAMRGQASVFAADSVDSVSNEEITSAFRRARQQDFDVIRREALQLCRRSRHARPRNAGRARRLRHSARILRERLSEIEAIDFFGAPGRTEAVSALADLERLASSSPSSADAGEPASTRPPLEIAAYRQRLWLTRPRPGIDRMGSAWLIRRFIDPEAAFRFVDDPKDVPAGVPFDMFEGEFSHHGGRCTFEVLADRFAITQPAVKRIAEMVHDLDLKDGRFGAPEAVMLGHLVEGLRSIYDKDEELIERGIVMFEALYRALSARTVTQRHAQAKTKTRGSR